MWQRVEMGTIAEFYDLETEKLTADGKKVALFTKHPGTLGAFREARLREYLKEHVPARLTLAHGFVSYRNGLGERSQTCLPVKLIASSTTRRTGRH